MAPGGEDSQQPYPEEAYRMSPYPKIPPINLTEEELDRQLGSPGQPAVNACGLTFTNSLFSPGKDGPGLDSILLFAGNVCLVKISPKEDVILAHVSTTRKTASL